MKKNIGLFFGSFNPVHVGHMIIANFIAEYGDVDEVWMVVSPHNPLKSRSQLANDYERLHMVDLAIGDHEKIRSSNIEFNLPKPSYTIDSLMYLEEQHPDKVFKLIMGGDNLATIHKWKSYELLLANYDILLYSRPGHDTVKYDDHPNVHHFDAPQMHISSTQVRKMLKNKKSIQYLVTEDVFHYLNNSNLYR